MLSFIKSNPIRDRRYADIEPQELSSTESILEAMERTQPLFDYHIKEELRAGNNVLIVAHKESIRSIIRTIDQVDSDKIMDVPIPKGAPMVYRFDKNLQPITQNHRSPNLEVHLTSAIYLEKPNLLKEALQRHQELFDQFLTDKSVNRFSTTERAIWKLPQEQDEGEVSENDPSFFEEYDDFATSETLRNRDNAETVVPKVLRDEIVEDRGSTRRDLNDHVVVFVRHGRTPHNILGLFTGWEDPPLVPDGVEDAKVAGRLLRKHGSEFDVLYTSWLTRAIETGLYILVELECSWIPIVKSWRLNERHYGLLQGKSKSLIKNEHGEQQLTTWRRSYNVPPPQVSSFSQSYPGNDVRRTKNVRDLRISFSESLVRSLEQRKLVLHRKFPKSESLVDCMARSIPFYVDKIKEEAVDKGKRDLITSHENAIRGILMHLCDIPEEAMNQLHLPNGLPLVYNVRGKCITLLQREGEEDHMVAHDFGPASKYLFRPCELGDAFFEQTIST